MLATVDEAPEQHFNNGSSVCSRGRVEARARARQKRTKQRGTIHHPSFALRLPTSKAEREGPKFDLFLSGNGPT